MATVLENIIEMAELVKETKHRTRLSEQTILRIIDMNLALAERGKTAPLQSEEQFEDEDGPIPFPEIHEVIEPEPDEDAVVAAATDETQE